jgi:hypothetical protein
MYLFTDRSLVTMAHGIVFGGAALMGLAAALFYLYAAARQPGEGAAPPGGPRSLSRLLVLTAAALWLAVLSGTYAVFPPYRATPPAGATDLSAYPRALVLANPATAWLHAFAMEIKEHAPWIAAMLATSVAFVSVRYRSWMVADPALRRMASVLLAVALALVSLVSLLGIFVNKAAPLQ